jgi:hypothetical protein
MRCAFHGYACITYTCITYAFSNASYAEAKQ